MIGWFTSTIASVMDGPSMSTLPFRTLVRDAAAVFSDC